MKTTILAVVVALMGGLAVSGCTAHVVARPAPVEVVHVETAPPTRVYYGGRWLHYRDHAYYYHDHGHWVVARSVPTHVHRWHRPVHVTRAVPHHRTHVRHRAHRTHRPRHYRKADLEASLDKMMLDLIE